MKRIVINTAIGGFSLSRKAWLRLKELGNQDAIEWPVDEDQEQRDADCGEFYCSWIQRDDPQLLQILDELGVEACEGRSCKIKIVEIPNDVRWGIWEAEGGTETVYDKDRIWY